MTSLRGFCADHNLSPATVKRWLNAHGYDTSNGLSDAAVAAAMEHFTTAATDPTTTATALTIYTGNHTTTLDLPGFDGLTIDLGELRTTESLVVDNPLAVAQQFSQTAEAIQQALRDDIAQRQQRLRETQQAEKMIAAKANELELETRLYQIEAGRIDQEANGHATQLADALGKLQRLGKGGSGS